MNGIATWKQAIMHLPRVICLACEKSNVNPADVNLFVLHQANLRLIEYIVRKMGYPLSRTFTNVQEIGNTGAASRDCPERGRPNGTLEDRRHPGVGGGRGGL